MKEKVLVTGVNGFVGHHVATQLNDIGIDVVGIGNQPSMQNDLAGIISTYISCDLTNSSEVSQIDLGSISSIINLAGFANVGASRGQGELYERINTGVHTTLYEECIKQGVFPRIIAVSTGAVYDPIQPMPITEGSKLIDDDKTNEYVVSKKSMERAVSAFSSRGLRCIIVRPFNHTGPGQLPGFLLPDLYEQIKESQLNNKPLMVGNLETRRDFTDVRDVASAYIKLALANANSLKHDIYNICSGRSVAGKDILRMLAESCGIDDIETETDPTRIRNNEVMDIFGENELIRNDTGWEPSIGIEQTISDFVETKRKA